MKQEREVSVEGTGYRVVISDEKETLLAARAAGRVPVGWLREGGEQDLGAARFLITELDGVDEAYLERVVRREMGLPWIIGESKRLTVREFTVEDLSQVIREPDDREADRVFYTPDKLNAYIRGQYGFYEYGLWAVVRKSDQSVIGKAGIVGCVEDRDSAEAEGAGSMPESQNDGALAGCQMELGYHIFTPYRRQGYAGEACRIILNYVEQEFACPVYADVECGNAASMALLEKLGFHKSMQLTGQKCTKSDVWRYRYVQNSR